MIPKIFTIAHLLLIVIASYFGVQFGYQMVLSDEATPDLPKAGFVTTASTVKRTIKKPLSAYDNIKVRNLFDTQPKKTDDNPPPNPGSNLEEASQELGLKLWGTVAGGKGLAYAVIEDKKERKQNLYTVDDKIKEATIKLILREQVILSVNGVDKKLQIEEMKTKGGRIPGFRARPADTRPIARSKWPAQKISLRREDINKSMNDLPNLMGQIKIRPNIIDGTPQGLRVSSIKPRSIFRRMGLRNGDVITGVNGQDIQTVDDALKLYDGLKSAPNATVNIKRRGRDKKIEYSIK